jgi:parvulin-like peptidyl-prolyl isomerase
MKTRNTTKCKATAAVLLSAGIILLSVALLAGCGGAAEAPDDSEVLATVGDVNITEARVNAFTELLFFLYGFDDTQISEDEKNLYRAETLDTMIQAAAMEQQYKRGDVLPDDADDRLQQFKDALYQTEGVEAMFAEKGITENVLRYYMETQFYFQALAAEATEDGALPTDAEIEAYYEAHKQEFSGTEERRISHILVGDANHSDEDRQLAEDIRGRIASGEESFEDMALEYGTDGTKDTGGDLDYHVKDYYVPEFGEAAFALPQGELSGIVESQFGFHILKVTDIRSNDTLDAQRESIRSTLSFELSENKAKELEEKFGVTYLSDKYPPPEERAALTE